MAYRYKHGDRPLDGHTIQRAVGSGGFGEVYYAISDGGREVALKYLRDNPQVELRGVSHCINLKSPHLVSIFDVKKSIEDDYFIIMEYCSGPSLRDMLIAEPNGFGPQKAAFFVREIAKGLSYLHDRGIVHRDLKPGNIFYDDGYVKIGDYGLSKFISISRHSAQTASVGTVHYMAPEIGSGNYQRGVDIYALGVMLYEMLLGKVPFEGSSMAEVLMKHLTTQPEVEDLPHPFGNVIRKALAKDPKERYQTVDEMMEELLDVEEVKESLAGFSPKSLEGAVRDASPGRIHTPMPSPNPVPPRVPGVGGYGGVTQGQPPYALPVGSGGPLPPRTAKRMDRISRKMDARLAKISGRVQRVSSPIPPALTRGAGAANVTLPAKGNRKKHMALLFILTVGLAVGLGILVASTYGGSCDEEVGAAAGMLVAAMAGGIALSRRGIRWFGAEYGPSWPQRLIRGLICAPLMAIAAAPMLDSKLEDEGLVVWLGLLMMATFASWDSGSHRRATSEMSFGQAIWKAIAAMICTAIVSVVIGRETFRWIVGVNFENYAFVAAGVAGCVSLILQAGETWFPAGTHGDPALEGQGQLADDGSEAPAVQHGEPVAEQVSAAHPRVHNLSSGTQRAEDSHYATTGIVGPGEGGPRNRWGITRAFWGLVAFVLMGVTIVTFLFALVASSFSHHEITGSVIGCTSAASFMLFALRKTTPVKRDGFWRETFRPFLQSLSLAGIGASITGIAREWGHSVYCSNLGGHHACVPEIGAIWIITGLVMASLLLLFATFFTGRRKRDTPRPFVIMGATGDGSQPAESSLQQVADGATPPGSENG